MAAPPVANPQQPLQAMTLRANLAEALALDQQNRCREQETIVKEHKREIIVWQVVAGLLLSVLIRIWFNIPHHGGFEANLPEFRTSNLPRLLWKKGENGRVNIPVVDGMNLDQYEEGLLVKALNSWNEGTCLNLTLISELPEKGDFIEIVETNSRRCFSETTGRVGHGRQIVGLNRKMCLVDRLLAHEIGHVVGLIHEHCRSIRDQYVSINVDNIVPEKLPQFERIPASRSFYPESMPYDITSIMHYSQTAGSKNKLDTIVSKYGYRIEVNEEISEEDKNKVNKMYSCEPHEINV